MISVLILTRNEEKDLPGCLDSVKWSDDVHILDSFSTDNTVQLARSRGASVVQREFDGYASQRNAGLKNTSFKYPWLFILDADERVPENMVAHLMEATRVAGPEVSAFRLQRKDYFFGSWLKHAQISPYYIRVVRPEKVYYHREINEVMEVEGEIREMKGWFDHYPFSKGISHWISKHNIYSTMEAQRLIDEQKGIAKFSFRKAMFDKDFNVKRFHQKGLFYKVPGRPVIKWFYIYLWRRGILDGRGGFIYATLQSIYEYFIVVKVKEMKQTRP
ncbi:MAG: glycosyltransferase family 2 protein [Chitinophagaceae bacterium]